MLVNTASDCGFTNQYAALQSLQDQHEDMLTVIAFPANDFKEQEKKDDDTITKFCTLNYGISFPLMKKSVVVKNEHQNEVYQWLTDQAKNGWNNREPQWNFSKYLVNELGELTHYFSSGVMPMGNPIKNAINK